MLLPLGVKEEGKYMGIFDQISRNCEDSWGTYRLGWEVIADGIQQTATTVATVGNTAYTLVAPQNRFKEVVRRMQETARPRSNLIFDVHFIPRLENNAMERLEGNRCEIKIFSGLLMPGVGSIRPESDDEFAAVLGHEMAHCLGQHAAIKAIFLNTRRDYPDDLLPSLRFYFQFATLSRALENEADRIGVQLMMQAGFNPQAAAEIFCQRQSSDANDALDIFSDHPADVQRCSNLREFLNDPKLSNSAHP